MEDTQKARQVTWPDCEEQEDEDDAPIHEVVQALFPLHKPPHAESRRRLRAEPPNKAKAKPKQQTRQQWPDDVDGGMNILRLGKGS